MDVELKTLLTDLLATIPHIARHTLLTAHGTLPEPRTHNTLLLQRNYTLDAAYLHTPSCTAYPTVEAIDRVTTCRCFATTAPNTSIIANNNNNNNNHHHHHNRTFQLRSPSC